MSVRPHRGPAPVRAHAKIEDVSLSGTHAHDRVAADLVFLDRHAAHIGHPQAVVEKPSVQGN